MSGRKVWVADDVLTAEDLNDYLMDQAVMVFATAAARSSAILSPTEGMITYRSDDNVFEVWSGSAWVGLRAESIKGITIFNSSTAPVANAVGDLWFY